MGYHPRIETSEISTHITSRTRNSALWFVNNETLEKNILGIVAKCSSRYKVKLYALAIQGNHTHQAARFPEANRASYTRDVNSGIAHAVSRYCPTFPGGSLWHRRYSAEYMSHPEDIEKYFFYIALQPVSDGLVDKISDYPGYNFFNDAINGIKRKYKLLNRTKLFEAKRYGSRVNIKDFYEEYELAFERLPGYEELTQAEYKKLMLQKLEHYRLEVIKERELRNKKSFLGNEKVKQIRPGTLPRTTKKIGQHGYRPRVLSVCNERRQVMKTWYFSIYFDYKVSSAKYREGDYNTTFPPGTYKPPRFTCACSDTLHSIMA